MPAPGAGVPPGGGPLGGTAAPLMSPGISGVAADAESVVVHWVVEAEGGRSKKIAVFHALTEAGVFLGGPVVESDQTGSIRIGGLTEGEDQFIGIAVENDSGALVPSEAIVSVRTSAPILVRSGADASIADGLSPATAFAHPFEAVLTAFANGGGNVWIGAGEYTNANLPVFAGVHLSGGFDPTFDLEQRDPADQVTIISGRPGLPIADVQGGGAFSSFDGITFEGVGEAPLGITVADTPVSFRNVIVKSCSGRGIRVRNQSDERLVTQLLGVASLSNGGDGLSVSGAFEFTVERSRFVANVQEGADFDDLVGLDGEDSSLLITSSTFLGNGTQGLDVDLAAPLVPGPLGSRFDLRIERCDFAANGLEGVLLDTDFDLVTGWSAEMQLVNCVARGNGASGGRLDLDSEADVLIENSVFSANALHGLEVTSETTPAVTVVSSSAFSGNGAFGVRAELGNAPVFLSHCALFGNVFGGLSSLTVESSASSCVFFDQAAPIAGARSGRNLVTDEVVFESIPEAWLSVVQLTGDRVIVQGAETPGVGRRVQVASDGVSRQIVDAGGAQDLLLDPRVDGLLLPGRLSVYPMGSMGIDEYALIPGSPAIGAGLAPPGAMSDAGPLGAPAGSALGLQAEAKPQTLRFRSVTPPTTSLVGANQSVIIRFAGSDLDPFRVDSSSVRVLSESGQELSVALSSLGNELQVDPPATGWPSGSWTIELYGTLTSTEGEAFGSPLILPMRSAP